MADQQPKTGKAPTQGKATTQAKAPTREMVVDESGVMRFITIPKGKATVKPPVVPAATTATSKLPAATAATTKLPAATQYRTSITTAALAPTATTTTKAVADDEIVFDDEGEIVTGEAKAKLLAAAPQEEDDDEIVFNNEGNMLVGEAKKKFLADLKAKEEKAKASVLRKPTNVKPFDTINEVEKMKIFYRYREKNPVLYTYTAEGNLEIKPGATGLPPSVIPLRAFSPLRPEEFDEIERRKKEAQKTIEVEYVQKMKELRQAHVEYNPRDPESAVKIVRLNEALRETSVLRNRILYPERWCKTLDNPAIQDILLNKPYEERKMGFDVSVFKRFDMSRQDAFGHYREHGEMMTTEMKGGGTVVLFISSIDDQKTGQFHPAKEREFVHNETKYASPYQAYETERFKELDNEGMVRKLLGTRSEKTIRQLVSNEPDQPANPLKLWEEILESFYTQFKDAAESLKATGSARFHIRDKQIGTPEYANALANVRTILKEKENDAPSNLDVVKQSVISKEQQEKAKVGAIVNNFRRGR
jgi:hypothetical protein